MINSFNVITNHIKHSMLYGSLVLRSLSMTRREDVSHLFLSFLISVGSVIFMLFVLFSAPEKRIVFDTVAKASISPLYLNAATASSSIKASEYVVVDVLTGLVLDGNDMYLPKPLASMTKVMTAYTALSLAATNTLITIQGDAIDGLDFGLEVGQVWTLEELVKYMLVISSNDAAAQIASSISGSEEKFVLNMNSLAESKSLQLKFLNASGLDIDNENTGGVGTSYSMGVLMGMLNNDFPSILTETAKSRTGFGLVNGSKVGGVPNTNQVVGEYFGLIASKTGFTDMAGGNLIILVDPLIGRPLSIVVMGSSKEGRFSDARTILKNVLLNIQSTN